MKDFFDRMNERIRVAMQGRYGTDDLAKVTLVGTLIFLVLSLLTGSSFAYLIAIAGLIFTYYRILSRDYAKRASENRWYLDKTEKVRKTLRIQKKRFNERKEFRYFKCPSCGQEVRVPKGKGHIRITCPKCRTQFDKTV